MLDDEAEGFLFTAGSHGPIVAVRAVPCCENPHQGHGEVVGWLRRLPPTGGVSASLWRWNEETRRALCSLVQREPSFPVSVHGFIVERDLEQHGALAAFMDEVSPGLVVILSDGRHDGDGRSADSTVAGQVGAAYSVPADRRGWSSFVWWREPA